LTDAARKPPFGEPANQPVAVPEKPQHLFVQQLPKPPRLRPILMFHFHQLLLPRRAFPSICVRGLHRYFCVLDSSSQGGHLPARETGPLIIPVFPVLLTHYRSPVSLRSASRRGRAFGSSPGPHDCRRATSPRGLDTAPLRGATRPHGREHLLALSGREPWSRPGPPAMSPPPTRRHTTGVAAFPAAQACPRQAGLPDARFPESSRAADPRLDGTGPWFYFTLEIRGDRFGEARRCPRLSAGDQDGCDGRFGL